MFRSARRLLKAQESGLFFVIILLGLILTVFSGSHVDRNGHWVNNFFNSYTLMQVASETSFFAIMAIGATLVIISGGIGPGEKPVRPHSLATRDCGGQSGPAAAGTPLGFSTQLYAT